MRNSQEQAILERARRFEAQALEEVFDTYSAGIYRYAYRLLGDMDLARDCMAETFNRFLYAMKQGGGPDKYLQAYLYRIAHNWITDYYRRNSVPSIELDAQLPASQSDEPDRKLSEQTKNQQLRTALSLLTPDQRQVIVLKYLEDWENAAIAQALNKPVGAIKALQHRGLESLRRILTRHVEVNA